MPSRTQPTKFHLDVFHGQYTETTHPFFLTPCPVSDTPQCEFFAVGLWPPLRRCSRPLFSSRQLWRRLASASCKPLLWLVCFASHAVGDFTFLYWQVSTRDLQPHVCRLHQSNRLFCGDASSGGMKSISS
eukprot:GHVN01089399.1.p1 GENE.GHVN01089399.1~~GHVN01089399.1.p1  ORF type:complete len:130 (-),score=1.81 GHVN01089399.1:159-548(-)